MKAQDWHARRLSGIGMVVLLTSCADPISIQSDPDATAGPTESVAFAKSTCKVDGSPPYCYDFGWPYSIIDPPGYARLIPSGDPNITNELIDPDDEAVRVQVFGSGAWSFRFDLRWDGSQFRDGGARAVAPGCPATFGLMETYSKTTVPRGGIGGILLRGQDADGTVITSDIVTIDPPQFWEGWANEALPTTMQFRKQIDVHRTKGKAKTLVCTVYVHDVEYTRVPV